LLKAGYGRPKWLKVGASMIAIDTLVHKFLHRTGILKRFEAAHPYGPGCYRPPGMNGMMGCGMMGRGMMGQGGPFVMRFIFALMDSDGDGTISLQEFQAAH
jgi:hypothetical protein